MEPISRFTGAMVALPVDSIDTDQIIPARYLKVTDRDGLGDGLFADWRRRPDGTPDPDFPLNSPATRDASILVAGENFGCGSSREHAPWALLGHGFRAVIARSFADIFRANALGNGLLPVAVGAATHARLLELCAGTVATATVDLENCTLSFGAGETERFDVEPFARRCLLDGVDAFGYLLGCDAQIAAYERARTASQAVAT